MKGPVYRDLRTNKLTTEEPERGELVVRKGDTVPTFILQQLPQADLTKTDKAKVKEVSE